MQGKSYKAGCPVPREGLRYLRVLHKDAQGRTLVGEMVVSRSIADDLMEILRALYEASYPIERMVLVDTYDADDERSMRANNSSGFNFRYIRDTRIISRHGRGEAVDINPLYNPYCKRRSDGTLYVEPATAAAYTDRTAVFPYKIVRGDLCWRLFTEKGFEWGGDWQHCRDWQHFERPEKR
ncbi:MAG: M15 family metallopeptidase [Bacteroidales bacterium]|nr:M15 family metallopeptidase [Bacteroidales bacterium]